MAIGGVLAIAGAALNLFQAMSGPKSGFSLDLTILEAVQQVAEQNVAIYQKLVEIDGKIDNLPLENARLAFELEVNQELASLGLLFLEAQNSAKYQLQLDFYDHMRRLRAIHDRLAELVGQYALLVTGPDPQSHSQISLVNSFILLFTTACKTAEALAFAESYRGTLINGGAVLKENVPELPPFSMLSYVSFLETVNGYIDALIRQPDGPLYRLALSFPSTDYFIGVDASADPKEPHMAIKGALLDNLTGPDAEAYFDSFRFDCHLVVTVRTWRGVWTQIVATDTRISRHYFSFTLSSSGEAINTTTDFANSVSYKTAKGHMSADQVTAVVDAWGINPRSRKNIVWTGACGNKRWEKDIQVQLLTAIGSLDIAAARSLARKPGQSDFENIEALIGNANRTIQHFTQAMNNVVSAFNYAIQFHTLTNMKARLDNILMEAVGPGTQGS